MFFKRIRTMAAIFLSLVIMLSQASFVFADDDSENPDGAPEITMINGPVFELTPGIENKVEILLKNISSYSANL